MIVHLLLEILMSYEKGKKMNVNSWDEFLHVHDRCAQYIDVFEESLFHILHRQKNERFFFY